MKKYLLSILVLQSLIACKAQIDIVDRPIIFDKIRIDLSVAYLKEHYGLKQDAPIIDPKIIVLHWTAIPTFEGSFDAFKEAKLPSWRPDIKNASALNVSSHFLIDQDGTIYRLMPETVMARHVIGLNHTAIGIENVGGTDNRPLTEAQLQSNISLVEYLAGKFEIEYLIGHYGYTNFEEHPLWLEKDEGYRTQKTDPGEDFMRKVREAVEKLNFKQVPKKTKN